MNDLVEFLLARYAEEKRIAHAAAEHGGPHWPDADGESRTDQLVHARHHDPARVLRQVEAKRRVVERCANAEPGDSGDIGAVLLAGDILAELSLPYADHPDYREEWRP